MGSLWVHLIVKMSLYRKGSAWNTFEIEELSVVELYTEHFRVLPEGSKKKKHTCKIKKICAASVAVRHVHFFSSLLALFVVFGLHVVLGQELVEIRDHGFCFQ